ncbi:MAG: hypothetical protein ACFE95_00245 [Candidatus Hodarchaeota archaeon]
MSYKVLSLIQVVFICLTAFSVLDYGYLLTTGATPNDDSLFFNKIMFDDEGLIGGILKDIDFWGMLQFWSYCFFIVAICQLIKAFTVKS